MPQPAHKSGPFTWGDYRSWPEDERWELIAGEAYAMSPSPTGVHQAIVLRLGRYFDVFFERRRCRAFIAPLDVKLSESDVVQPDLLVVCDPRQIKPTHIEGAPALVVEVLSPTSQYHDRARKVKLYAAAGVREFWLVTPEARIVEVLRLDGASYVHHAAFGPKEVLVSPSFPKLRIPLARVFARLPATAAPAGAAWELRDSGTSAAIRPDVPSKSVTYGPGTHVRRPSRRSIRA
jgi:Uma2 family endonuclease